ncbi:MAG: DsbA family protein [Pseudomonadota bacterium]
MRRRDALIIGAAIATAVAIPPILRRTPSKLEFEALPGAPGFRRLTAGSFSGAIDPFFGLDATPQDRAAQQEFASKPLCSSLFGPQGWPDGKVPVAVFTDTNCPYCKVLEARLFRLRDAGVPLWFYWHELPLLGPSSVRAARATLGARALGAEDAARSYLASHVLPPGPAGLARLSSALGVDPDALRTVVSGPLIDRQLAESLWLSKRLGIPGTPGTIVGRTLFVGAIKDADLDLLIEIEEGAPDAVCG